VVGLALSAWTLAGCVVVQHSGTIGTPKVVRAEQFVLVSPDGKEQGVIQAGADGPSIVLNDAEGRPRVQVGAVRMAHVPDIASWGMTVLDAEGHDRAAIGLADGAGVAVWDPQGVLRIGMGEGPTGVGIGLMDPDGRGRLGMGMAPSGWGSFGITDPDGKKLWDPTDPDQKAQALLLVDRDGKVLARIEGRSEAAGVVVKDADGKEIWHTP
jgi:hypothetical protein